MKGLTSGLCYLDDHPFFMRKSTCCKRHKSDRASPQETRHASAFFVSLHESWWARRQGPPPPPPPRLAGGPPGRQTWPAVLRPEPLFHPRRAPLRQPAGWSTWRPHYGGKDSGLSIWNIEIRNEIGNSWLVWGTFWNKKIYPISQALHFRKSLREALTNRHVTYFLPFTDGSVAPDDWVFYVDGVIPHTT